MKKNPDLRKYSKKVVIEAVIKAVVCALSVGLLLAIIPSAIGLANNINTIIIAVIVLTGVSVVVAPVFYFLLFKPKISAIADRVDELGLDERVITALQLAEDDSYIANLQREDTKQKIDVTSHKLLKFRFLGTRQFKVLSRTLCAVFAIIFAASLITMVLSVTEVDAMVAWQSRGEWNESVQHQQPPPVRDFISISYRTDEEGGGYIVGFTEQLVLIEETIIMTITINFMGIEMPLDIEVFRVQNPTPVMAVAYPGWQFSHWTFEGETEENHPEAVRTNPIRWDTGMHLTGDIEFIAVFQELGEGEGGGSGDNDEDEEGEPPPPSGDEDDDDNPPPPGDGTGGGRDNPNNQIIDGETYYRDVMDAWMEQALADMEAGRYVPQHIREMIYLFRNMLG